MTQASVTSGRSAEQLAAQCLYLADKECRDYSPLYERLCRQLAADTELLHRLTTVPDAKRVPLNLLAAVHYLARQQPDLELAAIYRGDPGDPWPPFRSFVVANFDRIVDVLATRTIQTNEVGRSAVLIPTFAYVANRFPDRELALIEIGPSAGLNLAFDRYDVTYGDGRRVGNGDSAVQLHCAVLGDGSPPLPSNAGLPIASRQGIDLAPVDIRDEDACAWLEACIWPDVPGRLERFRAAVAKARSDPPLLHNGDAVDEVEAIIAAVPTSQVPVVFSSWALAYFSKGDRQAVHDVLAATGTTRDLALVTAEHPGVASWVPNPPQPPTLQDQGATLIAVTSWNSGRERPEPVAWTHPHGQWLQWFDGAAP